MRCVTALIPLIALAGAGLARTDIEFFHGEILEDGTSSITSIDPAELGMAVQLQSSDYTGTSPDSPLRAQANRCYGSDASPAAVDAARDAMLMYAESGQVTTRWSGTGTRSFSIMKSAEHDLYIYFCANGPAGLPDNTVIVLAEGYVREAYGAFDATCGKYRNGRVADGDIEFGQKKISDSELACGVELDV